MITFQRSIPAIAAIGVLGAGILSAPAATASPLPGASVSASATIASSSSQSVFHIGSGKAFDVKSTVHGVRRGDRLALESLYAAGPRRAKTWHVLGSWPMTAGETHFVGKTHGTTPGRFTLRVQFVRNKRLLKGSQSNQFVVVVQGFSFKRPAKPHKQGAAISAVPGTVPNIVNNWPEPIQCAPDNASNITVGHGILIPPLVPEIKVASSLNVVQVIWTQQAAPGGTFGTWQVAAQTPNTLTPADPNDISIGVGGDTLVSDDLGSTLLYYPNDSGDVYRNIAWDLAAQKSDGSWVWLNPTNWYTPSSYEQWTQNGLSEYASNYCLTYNS
jgi:hypothetical protein